MPFIVDPANDNSNGVGKTFRRINIAFSIGLPVLTVLLTIYWGINHGFNSFI